MMPTHEVRLTRINSCISDLSENGIFLTDVDDQRLHRLVERHVDYFQMMLGYDSEPEEIVELVKIRRAGAAL